MSLCTRCGIDVELRGLCDDCHWIETGVERAGPATADRVAPNRLILSTSPVGKRWPAGTHEQIVALTEAGRSIREIALEVGCSSVMVSRVRKAAREGRAA